MSDTTHHWTPALGTQDLESRLENALRRAAGSVGYEISLDRSRTNTLKDSAAAALHDTVLQPGPLFANLGLHLASAGTLPSAPDMSLKDMAGDIMYEFYSESTAAFSLGLTELAAEAETWLRAKGLDEDRLRSVLGAAEKSYILPDKDRFSREAMPFVHEGLSMMGCVVLGGLAGLALGLVLIRAPHVALVCALAGGGTGWYLGKSRRRVRAQRLVAHLPRALAHLLFTQWKSNFQRYAEIVNAAQ